MRFRSTAFGQGRDERSVPRGRVTASSGIRKDPLTLAASRWPSCTRRYTVRFETRMIAATSKMVRNVVPAGEAEAPGIMPPTESEVPKLRAYLPNAVARQMVLQVAMQDIGQLTDIQHLARANCRHSNAPWHLGLGLSAWLPEWLPGRVR